jgi:hypothetical protein
MNKLTGTGSATGRCRIGVKLAPASSIPFRLDLPELS